MLLTASLCSKFALYVCTYIQKCLLLSLDLHSTIFRYSSGHQKMSCLSCNSWLTLTTMRGWWLWEANVTQALSHLVGHWDTNMFVCMHISCLWNQLVLVLLSKLFSLLHQPESSGGSYRTFLPFLSAGDSSQHSHLRTSFIPCCVSKRYVTLTSGISSKSSSFKLSSPLRSLREMVDPSFCYDWQQLHSLMLQVQEWMSCCKLA